MLLLPAFPSFILRDMVMQICDETNQAAGMSIINTASGAGLVIGPTIGGFLAQPAAKYAFFNKPLYRHYKFFLPCMVCAVICGIATVVGVLYLKDTRQQSRKKQDLAHLKAIQVRRKQR